MDSGDEENTNSVQRVGNMTLSLLDLNADTNASADGGDGEGKDIIIQNKIIFTMFMLPYNFMIISWKNKPLTW